MNDLVRKDLRDAKINLDMYDREIMSLKTAIKTAQREVEKVQEKMIDFRRTVMEDEQKEITNEMSVFLSEQVGVPPNVLRTFISLAISLWQTDEKKLVKDINDLDPEVRFEFVEAICSNSSVIAVGISRSSK